MEKQIQLYFLLLKKKTVCEFFKKLIQYQHKMTQYNNLNAKLSDLQLNKLKSGEKNGTEVTLKLPSKIVSDSNDETNFRYKFLLTDTQAL